MTKHEQLTLETFLQYGEIKNAKLVFVGLEEGLGKGNVKEAVDARTLLLNDPLFINNRKYLNGINLDDGWYFDNALCLGQAREIVLQKPTTPMQKLKPDYSGSLTMKMQARLHWLTQGNNRTNNYINMPNSFRAYTNLNKPGSESAMIDIYPFPKVAANNWPSEYQNKFITKKDYYDYYNNPNNIRVKILKNLYDTCPLNISVGYAGIKNGNFKLEPFYASLGFVFGERQFTNYVNPKYDGLIQPSVKPKPFIIGTRKNSKGVLQKVILTTFLGGGQISYNDIDVISTWI